ncbi:hypothetical protein TNIN_474671 [Trichonephila inaurata madagascariensis]|uniref:Uncharacterized protein n=1 Tax=Trichonephila inaurata madagascariensis TaxID=2747483 RepID=A0A8X6XPC7_9ARAC|nr:hypothetical protein TNIN_474671 [Trichonephila inaurata madagascariensis]
MELEEGIRDTGSFNSLRDVISDIKSLMLSVMTTRLGGIREVSPIVTGYGIGQESKVRTTIESFSVKKSKGLD